MKGTEKQVKWATEIRSNVVSALNKFKADCDSLCPTVDIAKQNKDMVDNLISLLLDDDVYAGDIIDLFKDVPFGTDAEQNVMNVMAVYRIAVPATTSGKKLLGR